MKKVFVGGLILVSLPLSGLAADRIFPRISGSASGSSSIAQISHHGGEHSSSGPKAYYPASYYADVVKEPFIEREKISSDQETEVCVIGAGLTGVSTALNLAEQGKSVIILESKRVSWNASGRNGGFAIPGFALEPMEMEEKYGTDVAKEYYKSTLDAADRVKRQIKEYNIECDLQNHGTITLSTYKVFPEELEELDSINKRIGTSYEFWDKEKTQKNFKTEKYYWALLEPNAFIVNPLGLTLGLSRAAESRGAKIFEDSPAIRIEDLYNYDDNGPRYIVYSRGKDEKEVQIKCRNVVLAGSCHIDPQLDWKLSRSTSPIFTYIGVTAPLSQATLDKIISPEIPYSIADDTTEINYYRILPDRRLLWGNFAQSFERKHSNLKKDIQCSFEKVFPQLKDDDIQVDYVWGGDIAMTPHLCPLIGRKKPGYYYATGFGGHGVIPTNFAGSMISDAIVSNDNTKVDRFQKLFPAKYVGWPCDRFFVQLYINCEKFMENLTKYFQ